MENASNRSSICSTLMKQVHDKTKAGPCRQCSQEERLGTLRYTPHIEKGPMRVLLEFFFCKNEHMRARLLKMRR